MLQKLTFKSFQLLSINGLVYKFSKPIGDFDKILTHLEKKPLYDWLADSYCEKRKETLTLVEFDEFFQGNFYFKLGVKLQ